MTPTPDTDLQRFIFMKDLLPDFMSKLHARHIWKFCICEIIISLNTVRINCLLIKTVSREVPHELSGILKIRLCQAYAYILPIQC